MTFAEKNKKELFLDRLPDATQKGLLLAAKQQLVSPEKWYLAGGTALALQVGHRESVDLDFFTESKTFDTSSLERKLVAIGEWETTLIQDGTLYGEMAGAHMSFIAYPFFHPSEKPMHYGHVRILPPEDIAAMKIIAVSQRGRKRDFIDLFWYCHNRENLKTIFERALKQYPQQHNVPHILKSLIYFEDAEQDPMPRLHFEADWPQVKNFFEEEVPRITKRLLGLD